MFTIIFLIFQIVLAAAAMLMKERLDKRIYKRKEEKTEDKYNRYSSDNVLENLNGMRMTAIIVHYAAIGIFLLTFLCSGFYTVDQGEGVILTQFGRIYDQVTDPGAHFKRPWADVVEWKTRLKSLNEQIEARSKDEMRIEVEITIWWKVQKDKLDVLYSDIAKDYDILQSGFVIPGIRSAVRDEVAKVSYEKLNSNREQYAESITKYVAEQLSKKYVVIDKINIRKITPPGTVNTAIEEKLEMDQKVKKAELKVNLAKKEAQVKIEEAKGIAEAQKIIQTKLTPLYVQWYAIEMQKKLVNSKNTTFYFVPMSKNSGIPMIYGAPK